MDIYVGDDGYMICNGIRLNITQENVLDAQNYGVDPIQFVINEYNGSKKYIRELKLKKLGL